MRILLLAWGSRGDVDPFLALGHGLRAAGHEVTVAAPTDFAARARAAGLGFAPFAASVAELTRTDLGRRWLGGTARTPVGELRLMREATVLAADAVADTLLRATPGQDLLVSSTLTFDAGWALERTFGIRHVIALFAPVLQSAHGDAYVYAPRAGRRSVVNKLVGDAVAAASFGVVAPVGAEVRRRLGLPRPTPTRLWRDVHRTPVLLAASPTVVPPAPDWPMAVEVTGPWWSPSGEALAPDLAAFLDAGPAPVYVGFGSMPAADPQGTSDLVAQAISQSGQRAVVLRGHADLAVDLPGVLMIDGAPHDALLPRCAAVVHHGGAGTTTAALRAGVPQVVVPHMGDQPYWARRMHELGVGAAPQPRRRLTADGLANALVEALHPDRSDAAANLGAVVRAERGVERAVELVERRFG